MHPILSMPPTRRLIMDQLAHFWNLQTGWDGRGGKRPSIRCLTSVGMVLNFLSDDYFMPNSIEAIPAGGIRAVWRKKPLVVLWDQKGDITATLGDHTEEVRDSHACIAMIKVALFHRVAPPGYAKTRTGSKPAGSSVYQLPAKGKTDGRPESGLRGRVERRGAAGLWADRRS